MKPIVIFGTGPIAEVADFYFAQDAGRSVAAFTVDADYLDASTFCGRPVIAFEDVATRYSPSDYDFFVALSYGKMNRVRQEKCAAVQALGYRLASYVSSRATTWPGLQIGENCLILENNVIQPFVRIGNNVTLWSGNHIGHHASIADHCFVTSHVVISGGVSVGRNCFIGVNSTIRDHVSVGERCLIGAGCLIVQDTEPDGVYTMPAAERSRVPSSRVRHI